MAIHRVVRGWAEYLGGTRFRFHCPAGHTWTEDLNRQSLPIPKRIGITGCQLFARYWQKGPSWPGSGGVNIRCTRCERSKG